jgi:uncharacterized protein (TIGR03067 family)
MRFLSVLILSAGVLSLAGGCGNKDSASGGAGSGAATPDGTYVIVSVEMDGEPMPEEFFSKAPESERTIRFSGSKMTAHKRGKEDTVEVNYDTTKTPAQFTTIEPRAGGAPGKTHGIYKIEGDTLTLCMTEGRDGKEEDRPKDFKTTKDGNAILMKLKKK